MNEGEDVFARYYEERPLEAERTESGDLRIFTSRISAAQIAWFVEWIKRAFPEAF